MDRAQKDRESAPDERDVLDAETKPERETDDVNRTPKSTGKMTSPRFGSAGAGGELEPGPEKN